MLSERSCKNERIILIIFYTYLIYILKIWVCMILRVIFLLIVSYSANADAGKRCLYVSSYNTGYEWNDGIERGIKSVIGKKCQLTQFYMDTKLYKLPEEIKKIAIIAKDLILETKPDVVIACDDNAAKYLVMPYFKDADTPFVFCGINWTIEPYGFPYSNVTGIVEISPIKPLIKEIQSVIKYVKKGVYIGPDVISQHKEFKLNKKQYKKSGIELSSIFVKNMREWEKAYIKAQQSDFIIIGNNGGIENWNNERAAAFTLKHAGKFSVTNYDWMAQYAMLAMTKVSEEQGEWAAKVALAILEGDSPERIPVVVNRRKHIYSNPALLKKSNIKLSETLVHQSIKVGM